MTGVAASEDRELAVRAVRAAARVSRVLERSSEDLTLPQYRVLAAVASGEERASRVASRLALGRPTVSAAVDQLSHRGLLVRGDVAGDQRAAALTVTVRGELLLDEVERSMIGRIADLCERTPDPRATMLALARLGDALDDAIADRVSAEAARA